jgi:hypothetical protein
VGDELARTVALNVSRRKKMDRMLTGRVGDETMKGERFLY